MRRAAIVVLAISLSSLFSHGARARDLPVVVELFTSESCSSCPPADAFLTDLARERLEVLPLAFHVTYWNDLGWKDPFSFPAATARQKDYARSLGGQVYTPEMVVNGTSAFVGSDRAQGLAEIASAARSRRPPIPINLTRDGQSLVITVGPGRDHATILLVGFDPQHVTPIGRGENGGRTLLESNIVRSLTIAGQWQGAATELRQEPPPGERFAVLLQDENGRILSAATLD